LGIGGLGVLVGAGIASTDKNVSVIQPGQYPTKPHLGEQHEGWSKICSVGASLVSVSSFGASLVSVSSFGVSLVGVSLVGVSLVGVSLVGVSSFRESSVRRTGSA
jgi:hypothetical protein